MYNDNHKNYDVITFGCRLNAHESAIIEKNIKSLGCDNIAVFNSCSVTQNAENEVVQAIRKYRRRNPDKKIIVTGCAAQYNPELFSKMSEVDKVLGNKEKLSSEYYREFAFDPETAHQYIPKTQVGDIMSVDNLETHFITEIPNKSRAFLQVQNGCNHRCTFCMIPYARGNSRSVPVGDIVKQVNLLIDNGYKEIVFTGVDATSYGQDLPGTPSFSQMIRRVLNLVPKLSRLRLSSIDVAEIDQDLFDLFVHEKRLMPHVHISLQAGDDMILKRMKRRHNRQQVIDFVHKLRNARSEVAFGADIIAGFPTETDIMFENTRRLVEEAGIQYLHVFPYSERSGTPASRMPQVDVKLRNERAEILREEGIKQRNLFFKRHIGTNARILIEGKMAHSENFIPVSINNDLYKTGEIYDVVLGDISENNRSMNIRSVL